MEKITAENRVTSLVSKEGAMAMQIVNIYNVLYIVQIIMRIILSIKSPKGV